MIPGLSFLLGLGVTLFAAVTRFARLTVPKSLIPLDEFYYPVNALGLLRHGSDFQLAKDAALPGVCSQIAIEPAFAVHPPVGKWLIGAGMRLFGCNALGWRFAAALFGTLAVLLVYLIGRRLFRSPWVAALGAMLLALDGLFFVQSRIAMLDIFLAFFVVLAIWLLTEDRARTLPGPTGIRWWRIGSAIAIGLAVATKWSALFLLPFLLIVALVWELDRRRRGRLAAAQFAAASVGLQPAEGALSWEPRELDPDAGEEPPMGDAPLEEAPPEAVSGEGAPSPPWDEVAEPVPAAAAAPLPPPPPQRSFGPELLKIAAIFSLIPLLVYIVAYLPWFFGSGTRYKPPRCATQNKIAFDGSISPVNSRIWNADVWPDQWQEFVCYQREIWDFHKNLKTIKEDGKPSHPYLSRAWSWPWMGRPASHYFDTRGSDPPCEQPATNAARVRAAQISQATPGGSGTGATIATPSGSVATPTPSPVTSVVPADPTRECKTQAEILGVPNPGLWFPAFFLALPFAFYRALFRRDQVAALLLLLFVPLYLPWLVTTRPLFLFYMTPAVPILALLVAHLADRVTDEMKPWQQTVAFSLMMMLPFTPLFVQMFSTGRPAHLLYKVPLMGVIFLVLNGVATLLAYTPKPRRLMLVYGGLVLALFSYFYPVLAAVHIPDGGVFGWRNHMWVKRDCGREGILLNCWI